MGRPTGTKHFDKRITIPITKEQEAFLEGKINKAQYFRELLDEAMKDK